jgi:glycogen synthase
MRIRKATARRTLLSTPNVRQSLYGKNLAEEVERYAREAERIAREEDHDVIHAHDWLTYKAGIAASRVSGKPLVVHVHATEYDRTGGSPDPEGPRDRSRRCPRCGSRDRRIELHEEHAHTFYDVDHTKVTVVHNGYNADEHCSRRPKNGEKNVLFLGRLTLQKGPEYFLRAARRVVERVPDAHFIVAGDGDMFTRSVHLAADLGIANRVSFTGFLSGPDIARAYELAQVYVMPSVSEPFGITALEAMGNATPVILSKQSGVSEVVEHALKIDFWDTEKLAHHICRSSNIPVAR